MPQRFLQRLWYDGWFDPLTTFIFNFEAPYLRRRCAHTQHIPASSREGVPVSSTCGCRPIRRDEGAMPNSKAETVQQIIAGLGSDGTTLDLVITLPERKTLQARRERGERGTSAAD
eukprot:905618-Rhodomonas_salina.1